jgi:hypothetical protein
VHQQNGLGRGRAAAAASGRAQSSNGVQRPLFQSAGSTAALMEIATTVGRYSPSAAAIVGCVGPGQESTHAQHGQLCQQLLPLQQTLGRRSRRCTASGAAAAAHQAGRPRARPPGAPPRRGGGGGGGAAAHTGGSPSQHRSYRQQRQRPGSSQHRAHGTENAFLKFLPCNSGAIATVQYSCTTCTVNLAR